MTTRSWDTDLQDLSTEHRRLDSEIGDVVNVVYELRDRAWRIAGRDDELTHRLITAAVALMDARSQCQRIIEQADADATLNA